MYKESSCEFSATGWKTKNEPIVKNKLIVIIINTKIIFVVIELNILTLKHPVVYLL
jgi:hypothetical protein